MSTIQQSVGTSRRALSHRGFALLVGFTVRRCRTVVARGSADLQASLAYET
jgi:hypothetical protein